MNYTQAYVMLGLGTILVLFWGYLFYRSSNQFEEVINNINRKEFFLPTLFCVGFTAIELFSVNLHSPRLKKRRKLIAEIHGEDRAEFYQYVIIAGQISYFLTLMPISLFLGALANDRTIAFLGTIAAIVLVYYLNYEITATVSKRREELLLDLPQVLSKLVLLINAGLVLREAWIKVASTGSRALYVEMQITSIEIENGVNEQEALQNFAQRCAIKEIRKFAAMVVQSLQKGSSDLTWSLKEMANESWEAKKNMVQRKGEIAGQKLLIPIAMMFIGILILIIVPVFANLL